MKTLLVLALLIAGLVAALYYGGAFGFDPAEQAQAARDAIKPGMPWTEVVSVAGETNKCSYSPASRTVVGRIDVIRAGPEVSFDADNITQRVEQGNLIGFSFKYIFSAADGFWVNFDASGNVTEELEIRTTQSLLDLP